MTAAYHNKALPKGAVLREWRLEQVLGVGGFGIVYRGRGLYFDEMVAIKEYFPSAISDRIDDTTVAPSDSSSEEIYALGLQKFVEEAKVLWNLSKPERHPNIVSVRSLFEINGTAYMVMDFENGVSLSQMLKNGARFNEALLLRIITPIAEGLDRAHRAGVLHRDIKPANILVDEQGRPVLIDFGSARFESGQATSTKVTFYTPPYAAIEQYVKTYPQGPWTDIYALGVTLYECVAGEKPPEVLERLHGGLGEALSAKAWPGFSPAFTRAVDAAMAIKPADRPQSISQWLAMFKAGETVEEEPTRIAQYRPAPVEDPGPAPSIAPLPPAPAEADAGKPRSTRNILIAGGAAVALAAAAVVAVGLSKQPAKPTPSAPVAAAPTPVPATTATATAQAAPSASLGKDLDALLADAQAQDRPAGELAVLAAAKAKITGIAADLTQASHAAGAGPKVAALTDSLDGAAADMARSEAGALKRSAAAQLRDLQGNPGGPEAAALREAKAALDAALAGVAAQPHADQKILAADQALAAFKTFTAAYQAARPVFLAAQKANYAAIDAAARQSAADLVRLAGGAKPWLFASKAAKDAYQLAQDNAARARSDLTQLDAMAATVRSSEQLKAVNAAVGQAGAIRQALQASDAAVTAALHPAGR